MVSFNTLVYVYPSACTLNKCQVDTWYMIKEAQKN